MGTLKTDYKNYIPDENGRRYSITTDALGYTKITDATNYLQEGDNVGANDINAQNREINNRVCGGTVEHYSDLPIPTSDMDGYIYTVLKTDDSGNKGTYQVNISVPESYEYQNLNLIQGTHDDRPEPSVDYTDNVYYETDTGLYSLNKYDSENEMWVWQQIVPNLVTVLPEPSAETKDKYYYITGQNVIYFGIMNDAEFDYKVFGLEIDESESEPNGFVKRQDGKFIVNSGGGGGFDNEHFHYQVEVDNGSYSDTQNWNAVKYLGENANYTPASNYGGQNHCMGTWEYTKLYKDFMRPCVIAYDDVSPKYYLNKNDYTQIDTTIHTDWLDANPKTTADLSGADGDVMVEFKKLYIKFEKLSVLTDNDKVIIHISDTKLDNDYECTTGYIDDDGNYYEKNQVYIGAYTCALYNSKISSISGVGNLVSITRDAFVDHCKTKTILLHDQTGLEKEYYNLNSMKNRSWLWCIAVLMYRNKNLRGAIGTGRGSASSALNTGTMNNSGFCWGDSGNQNGVKLFGIENLWGNLFEHDSMHALYNSAGSGMSSKPIIKYTLNRNPNNYSQQGINYESQIELPYTARQYSPTDDVGYYGKAIDFGNLSTMGFVKEIGASLTTYACASGDFANSQYGAGQYSLLLFGGDWAYASVACLLYRGDAALSDAGTASSARLCRY